MSVDRDIFEARQRSPKIDESSSGLSHDNESPAAAYYENHRARTVPEKVVLRDALGERFTFLGLRHYNPARDSEIAGDAGKKVLEVIGLDSDEDSKRAQQRGGPRRNSVVWGIIKSPKR